MWSEKRHVSLEERRDDLARCVKCGSCGAVCPTYLHEHDESYSARGRMALVRAALEGRVAFSAVFKDRLATCTGCLACEASCPSGVRVTEIIQTAKELAIAESGAGIVNRVLSGVVKRPAVFRAASLFAPAALHYAKQGSGAGVQGESTKYRVQSTKEQGSKGRVAFFPGCAIEYFQPDIGNATIGVLNAIGYDVIVPEDLKCCGRPLLSLGDRQAAEELAAHNAARFAALEADALVTACASCGLTFKKEYPKLLRPGVKTPVVLDIHDFLSSRIAGTRLNAVRKRVTIHDPCHLGRGQGLSRTMRDLLQTIPGLTLVEMRDPDRCCGFGGVMRITRRGLSDGIAAEKAENIIATGAVTVATGCPACCMQIAEALRRRGADIETVHTMQLLQEALSNAECEVRSAELEMAAFNY